MWAAVEDEVSQRKGLIYVMYNVSALPVSEKDVSYAERNVVWRGARYVQAFPVRIKCLHFCTSFNNYRPLLGLTMLGAGSEHRTRFRFHDGKQRIVGKHSRSVFRAFF